MEYIKNNDLTGLNREGFDNKLPFDLRVFNGRQELISRICDAIAKYLTKQNGYHYGSSSYGQKHIMERFLGEYVSNGEYIFAMDQMCFKISRDRINAYFNVKASDLRILELIPVTIDRFVWRNALKPKMHLTVHKKLANRKYLLAIIFMEKDYKGLGKEKSLKILCKHLGIPRLLFEQWVYTEKGDALTIPDDMLQRIADITHLPVSELIN